MSDIIVDTSVFVNYLRGRADDALAVLILNNQVLLSPVVKLELLVGTQRKEINIVESLLNALKPIPTFPELALCQKLIERGKGSGLLSGLADLMILADCSRLKVPLFTYDKKLERLASKLRLRVI